MRAGGGKSWMPSCCPSGLNRRMRPKRTRWKSACESPIRGITASDCCSISIAVRRLERIGSMSVTTGFPAPAARPVARPGCWVCLVSETLDLPRVHVEGVPHTPGWMKHLQDAWADAMDSPGAKRWVLGDQDFDRRYRVFHFGQGAAPAWLSRLATILRQMSDGVGVDMEKDVLVLTSIGILADRIRQKLDPQKLLDLMDCANRLREGFALESGADKQHPPPEHAIRLDLTP